MEAFVEKLGEMNSPVPEGIIRNGTREQLAYLLQLLREAGLFGTTGLWALAERAYVMHDVSRISRTSIQARFLRSG